MYHKHSSISLHKKASGYLFYSPNALYLFTILLCKCFHVLLVCNPTFLRRSNFLMYFHTRILLYPCPSSEFLFLLPHILLHIYHIIDLSSFTDFHYTDGFMSYFVPISVQDHQFPLEDPLCHRQ